MWLLPRPRLPFSSPMGFLRWFATGINLWAVGAVVVCVFAGWALVERFSQPRQLEVEQALSGGEGTRGLTYTVERTGEKEATVTGTWDTEKDQRQPGPELAAALCAALSPEEIYGHSDHLYRAIASRFFEGEDFDLVIRLRRTETRDEEKPEPIFTVVRPAGSEDWSQPDCAAAFEKQWRDHYSQYWLFGQGRKEEMGPPQSDPIIEVGDLPPEPSEPEEEEAPPLPDLDGIDGPDGDENGGEGEDGEDGEDPDSHPPEGSSSSSSDGGSSSDGEDTDHEETPPSDDWLDRLLAYASRYRGLSWKEAWALFLGKED